MTNKPLPVAGYTPQSDANVALVNEFKQDEERLLRKLDAMQRESIEDAQKWLALGNRDISDPPQPYSEEWLWEARRLLQLGFMALNRAVFQPTRIKLPEDEPSPQDEHS